MKAIRLCFFQMLLSMRRDRMLLAACLAPAAAGFGFRFAMPGLENALTKYFGLSAVISPFYALFDILLAMLSPAMFCFASAMISLEEKDDRTAAYLFVTPLGRRGYLAARFGVPSAVAFLVTVLLLPVFSLTALPPLFMVLLAAGGSLQGVIVSLLIVTFSSNKLEGMAVAKLSSLMMLGAAVPFFVSHKIQYVMSPLPSFWIGKAVLENMPCYMLPGFVLPALWISLLLKRYLRML